MDTTIPSLIITKTFTKKNTKFISAQGVIVASRILAAPIGVLLSVLLSACAFVDAVEPRHDSINRAAATARNEAILLNIVRASRNLPLNFVAFSKVSGTTSIGAGAGLPAFAVGPRPLVAAVGREFVFGNSTLNGTTSASNFFDITVLESKDFYAALLSPVDLATLYYFVRQGYSHELLFWLFTEMVEETVGGVSVGYQNSLDPTKACSFHPVLRTTKCFQDLVDIAVATGLTVQTAVVEKPISSRIITYVFGRLCFDSILAGYGRSDLSADRRARIDELLLAKTHNDPSCRTQWNPLPPTSDKAKDAATVLRTDTLTFRLLGTRVGPVQYRIVTRSTFGIYQFLGALLARRNAGEVLATVPRDEDNALLRVANDQSSNCFVDLNFQSEKYCVPDQGAQSTKRIFGLLSQLLALKTQAGDLAITPSTRVTQ